MADQNGRDVCKRHTANCPNRKTRSPKAVQNQSPIFREDPMETAGPDMTLDINHMTQFDPPGGSNDLDMQLQLTADEISAWTVQNPNLDLSVYH